MENLVDYNEGNSGNFKLDTNSNKKLIKKSTSLDSINAVEKELDDVLKGIYT